MSHSDRVTRRRFLRGLASLSTIPAGGMLLNAGEPEKTRPLKTCADCFPSGEEKVIILLYPGFTAMDALGPEYFLSCMTGAKVRFIAKTAAPVRCESGFEIIPHLTFDQLPEKPDLFLVPGGAGGTLETIGDRPTCDFIRNAGLSSVMAGSVCTGSLLLGVAGLLEGYEATSHWQTLELLPLFGAIPSTKRVVFDRNRVTGAGVTAGLDLALEVVRMYRGDFYARGVQLLGEYDPRPVFPGGGNPETAGADITGLLNEMHRPFVDRMKTAIDSALKQDAPGKPPR